MTIKLLHHSPLWLASHAIRMSRDNHDKSDTTEEMKTGYYLDTEYDGDFLEGTICTSYIVKTEECGEKDASLIERIGNKHKHKSVLEQLVYWFDIDGISRACLQELARHRTARLTVKSSRYTLKELKDSLKTVDDFLVTTGNTIIDTHNWSILNQLQQALQLGISNDTAKYMLPESFKTRLQWQIDGRNLQNFLELRANKEALWEIRDLAYAIYDNLPDEHKYLYTDYLYKEIKDV